MAVVFSDNFDSYSNGDLNGQGSWTGHAGYDVQGTTVQAGSKAIQALNNLNGAGSINRTFASIATGNPVVSYYARNTTASTFGATVFLGDGTHAQNFGVYMYSDNLFKLFDGATFTSTGASWSPDTWYLVEMEVDVANKRARARVNGGTWTSYVTNAAALTQLASIQLVIVANNSGTSYWDTLSIDDGAASGPANLKKINGLAKARVKTVNGLAIASVKSVNGLT